MVSTTTAGTSVTQAVQLQGQVHGGQQAVSNTSIQLYAAGTAGYGSASTPLLATPAVTDANGNFTISGQFTCPAGALVYLVGTGGNPGVTGAQNNSALALMVGLGPCASLTSSTYIAVNELTTVATVWALAPFMNSVTQVGTSATNTQGLINAFAAINKLVDTRGGTVSGPALPAGATLPVSQINTLANILSACVNSIDSPATASQSSLCHSLFTAAATASSTPTDTVQAAINLAHNPTLALSTLSNLIPSIPPFQPTLSSPPSSWSIAINYIGGGLSAPSGVAVDASGNVWLPNSGNNSVTKLDNTGAAQSPASGFSTSSLSVPSAIALDTAGNAWITNSGNNSVAMMTPGGAVTTTVSGHGIAAPSSVSVDAVGNVWVANYGSSSITQLSGTGAVLSGTSGYTAGGVNHPMAVAVSAH